MKAFKVYDTTDDNKLHDVLAHGPAHAIGVVSHFTKTKKKLLTVEDANGKLITHPSESIAHG